MNSSGDKNSNLQNVDLDFSGLELKPDTLKPSGIKEWLRVKFLYPYLKSIPKKERTLDLACGYGFSFKINPNFYGIELDSGAYDFCRLHNFKVKQGNLLCQFPFEGNTFDNVFSHDVLEHFELSEVGTIFENVHRVLKKGGVFMNVIPNKKGYRYGCEINAGHKHFITAEEVRELAQQSGFEFLRSYVSPLPKIFHELFTHNKVVTLCRKL